MSLINDNLCQHLKDLWIWFVVYLIEGVGNATACVVQDRIYVTGGHYGYRGSCTYEKVQTYRADINEWSITTISPHPGRVSTIHTTSTDPFAEHTLHFYAQKHT